MGVKRAVRESFDVRRVKLRVQGMPWLENYHGAEARIIGDQVDALEVTTADTVAFVDDRDGAATELWEDWQESREAYQLALGTRGEVHYTRVAQEAERKMRDHFQKRLLHGFVSGVRT